MKVRRQAKLLEIIENEHIETQKEMAGRLRAFGFDSTQATVSRDIKELRLVKVPDGNGTYKYAQPGAEGDAVFAGRLRTFRESVTGYRAAQNIVVLKTLAGLAMAAAAAVDAMRFEDIVGSLAGDDTVFLVFEDNGHAAEFCKQIKKLLEG